MTKPSRFIFRMGLFLLTVLAVVGVLYLPLHDAFMGNAPLNGLILGVLMLGIIYNFRMVFVLYPEVQWIDTFREAMDPNRGLTRAISTPVQPRLLGPMAAMVSKRETFSLSTVAMRSLLDGIYSRLEESRDISRYTIGLLIFLGLLGTFWGLLETVASIGNVISGLNVGSGDTTQVFGDLKEGLQAPLSGMGTAFSSSLFGLAGSLVLGFLDLQGNQAQNRFYNELEDWLSTVTRLSSGALGTEGEASVPAYVQALLEQTAESLEKLQHTLARGEESRISSNSGIVTLSNKLEILVDHMRTSQLLMKTLGESHMELKPFLIKMSDTSSHGGGGGAAIDEATKQHIRNLDTQLSRFAEDARTGRDETLQQLRSEIRLLARTIAASNGSS